MQNLNNNYGLLKKILKGSNYILFFIIFIVFSILSPHFSFFSVQNVENIITQSTFIGIVAIGMTFVLLTGGIDLSVGGNMFFTASIASLLMRDYHAKLWMALAVACLLGTLVGIINAFFIVKLKVLPFIATMCLLIMLRALTKFITKSEQLELSGDVTIIASIRISGIPMLIILFAVLILAVFLILRSPLGHLIMRSKKTIENNSKSRMLIRIIKISGLIAGFILCTAVIIEAYLVKWGIPLLIIIFAIIIGIAFIILRSTPFGRQVYAVGNDVERAKKAGINVNLVITSVYTISGLLAAVGGIIAVAQAGAVNAGFGKGYEFNAIASAVLGGTSLFGGVGNVFPGTFIGTVLIQTVNAGLVFTQANSYFVDIITSLVIFLAVYISNFRKTMLEKLDRLGRE